MEKEVIVGRNSRIVIANGIYHVMNRGNRGNKIFTCDADRTYFLTKLKELNKEFSIDVFSYVLMENHYHLLIKTNYPNLPQFMQRLALLYTKFFNYSHGLNGHLFQDRYKAFLIENEAYLIAALRYIALNPVLAGIVNEAKDYKWSSFAFLRKGKGRIPDWIKIDEALELASISRTDLISLVRDHSIDYGDYIRFESPGKLTDVQISSIVSMIEAHIGEIKGDRKLRDVVIFYLASLGAERRSIAKAFFINERNVQRILAKCSKEIEKGNPLYLNVLDRVKNVLLVPGTNVTLLRQNRKEQR